LSIGESPLSVSSAKLDNHGKRGRSQNSVSSK